MHQRVLLLVLLFRGHDGFVFEGEQIMGIDGKSLVEAKDSTMHVKGGLLLLVVGTFCLDLQSGSNAGEMRARIVCLRMN